MSCQEGNIACQICSNSTASALAEMVSKEERGKEALLFETPSPANILLQTNKKAGCVARTESCTVLSQLKNLGLVPGKNVRTSEEVQKKKSQKGKKYIEEEKVGWERVKIENKQK